MRKWVGAAGCCINDDCKLLMVKGNDDDIWSVPSGGQELNESLEECCVREVWEETGYKVEVVRHLTTKKGTWGEWNAEVHYFLVRLIGGSKQFQDPDALIGNIDWISRSDIGQLQLQYPEDHELLMGLLESSSFI